METAGCDDDTAEWVSKALPHQEVELMETRYLRNRT